VERGAAGTASGCPERVSGSVLQLRARMYKYMPPPPRVPCHTCPRECGNAPVSWSNAGTGNAQRAKQSSQMRKVNKDVAGYISRTALHDEPPSREHTREGGPTPDLVGVEPHVAQVLQLREVDERAAELIVPHEEDLGSGLGLEPVVPHEEDLGSGLRLEPVVPHEEDLGRERGEAVRWRRG
jgi:hypothetical protein